MENRRFSLRSRAGLVSLFLILFPLVFAAAIEAEWKDQIIENQRFTLKYITSFQGRQTVEIQDPEWPEGISKISGPYTAQRTIQKDDGSFATVLQVIYTLRAAASGIYDIPSVSVTDGVDLQRSQALEIPILKKDESFLNYPLLLDWLDVPESLYVGQAVPLVLMLSNMEEITLPDNVSLLSPESAILEMIRGLGEIQFSGYEDTTLFHVPMETWMLTPSKAGTLQLGSAEVKILGLTRKTENRSIRVVPLPDAVSTTGAVGDFKYSIQTPEENGAVGDTVQLKIRVEGIGNLNYLVLPKPEFPDSITVVSKDLSDMTAHTGGFEGYRELQYSLNLDAEGPVEIRIPEFSWLNPQTGKVFFSPSRIVRISVLSLLESLSEDDESYTLIPYYVMRKGGIGRLFRNPYAYLLLFPGMLLFGLVRLGRRRKVLLTGCVFISLLLTGAAHSENPDTDWIDEAQTYFEQGDFETALGLYRRAPSHWEGNAYFLYNKGILHYLNGQEASAIASLRSALYLKPDDTGILNGLNSMEERLDLDHQLEFNLFLSPDLLFVILILSLNLVFILPLLSGKKHYTLSVLAVMLFSISTLASGIELARSVWILNRDEAVIRQDVSIRKIPDIHGRSWISLPEGTTVEVIRKYQEFVLINTAYGLEGWILRDDLILIEGGHKDEI